MTVLTKECIVYIFSSRNAIYLDQTSTWYDIKSHKPIFNKEGIASIARAIEIAGLVGLDRLFSFMIITAVQKLLSTYATHYIK